MNNIFKFEFTAQELDIIAAALSELPYKMAKPILDNIQKQFNDQTQAKSE